MTRAQILQPTPENLALAASALLAGEPVGIPTETVYGLAGSARDPLALARIFETKERPVFDPLIIHVGLSAGGSRRIEDLSRAGLVDGTRLSEQGRETADRLMAKFWPGPLTLVLPKDKAVPDLATSGLDTVAIRMPRHPVAQALIAACGIPLAAPSANRFGRISPTRAQDVVDELGDRIDYVLDGGACQVGVESTVLSVGENGELTLLRPGGLALEEIEAVVRPVSRTRPSPGSGGPAQPAPGMLESHYAPRKPVFLLPSPLEKMASLPPEWKLSSKIGLLAIQGDERAKREKFEAIAGFAPAACRVLSSSGNLAEAARDLFATLRALDQMETVIQIVAEPCTLETGLGYAIGDRLRRAAAPRQQE